MPEEKTPQPQVIMSSDQYKREQVAAAKRDAEENRRDETVKGGRYLARDGKTLVDANGKKISGPEKP